MLPVANAPLRTDTFRPEQIAAIPRFWGEFTPDAAALWDRDARVTYAELLTRIDAGRALLEEHGVVRGDRVILVAENCAAEIALFFAASELGAWPVIVNARMSEREIAVICAHSQPRLCLYTSHISSAAAAHAERAQALPVPAGCFAGIALGATDPTASPENAALAVQVATIIYTSGTTGAPKGVMVTHRGLLHFCEVSSSSRSLVPADRVYAALPLSHIFGIATVVLATLYAGASIYLEPSFEPARAIGALTSRDISILQGVPVMFRRLLTYLQSHPNRTLDHGVRYLYTGGGALDPDLKAQVEALFDQPLHHGYGMTEYAGSMFVTRMDRPRRDCSSGYLNSGCRVRVVDALGVDVEPGAAGEIWVDGPGTMLGYYRAPESTRETLTEEGWLKTGDTGRIDADGALFIIGRNKDLIKRSGFNVYPIEVEAVLNSYTGVKSSAVVGRPLADGNEEVVAFVEMETGVFFDNAGMTAWIKDQLTPYKRPSQIVAVSEMPVNANGKILKVKLRESLKTQ